MSAAAEVGDKTILEAACWYIERYKWGLCKLRPNSKSPESNAWNTPALYVDTVEKAEQQFANAPLAGIGLIHSASGTGAWDIDDYELTKTALSAFGYDVDELLRGYPQIKGRENRRKIIFRMPPGHSLTTKKLNWLKRNARHMRDFCTLFELRTGAMQDVLPPSIHPDTGVAYSWELAPWAMDEIPMIPAFLLEIWAKFDDTYRKQLESECPWWKGSDPVAPKPVKRHLQGDGESVIDQFNAAHDIRAMLESYGYKSKGGRRMLAPTSSTKIPGVVFMADGRFYSHHASDVFNDSHAHDAFDIFCTLEHGGDVSAAIQAASLILGIGFAQAVEDLPKVDISGLIAQARAKQERDEKPAPTCKESLQVPPPPSQAKKTASDLDTIPVKELQNVAQWIAGLSEQPHPDASIVSALALGSVLTGRLYRSENDNYTSMQFVMVGSSGIGKGYGKTGIEKVLDESGYGCMIAGDFYTHQAALYSQLRKAPAHICISDEFGDNFLEARKNNNSNKLTVFKALKKVYSDAGSLFKSESYASHKRAGNDDEDFAPVRRPSVTLLGLTTPRQFYGEINEAHIEGGLFNRFVVVNLDKARLQPRQRKTSDAVPDEIKEWAAGLRDPLAHALSFDLVPAAEILPFTPDARARFDLFLDEQEAHCEELEKRGLENIPRRWRENAMRLATMLAVCSADRVITLTLAQWAIDYVVHHGEATICHLTANNDGAGSYSSQAARILGFIVEKGGTVNQSQIADNFKGIKPKDRREILTHLEEAEKIERIAHVTTAKGGRPAVLYRVRENQD